MIIIFLQKQKKDERKGLRKKIIICMITKRAKQSPCTISFHSCKQTHDLSFVEDVNEGVAVTALVQKYPGQKLYSSNIFWLYVSFEVVEVEDDIIETESLLLIFLTEFGEFSIFSKGSFCVSMPFLNNFFIGNFISIQSNSISVF